MSSQTSQTSAERLANLETWMRRTFVATTCAVVLLAIMVLQLIYSQWRVEMARAKADARSAELQKESAARDAKIDADMEEQSAAARKVSADQFAELMAERKALQAKRAAAEKDFNDAEKKLKDADAEPDKTSPARDPKL